MPLSNVFRHSFPNPFHNSSRKNRHAHARSGSTNGSSTSIVVVPVVEGNNNTTSNNTIDINKPLPSIFGRSDSRKMFGLRKRDKSKSKDKDDDDKKKRQGSQATSKSNHSSLSARHLVRLDPDATTPLPRPSSPSDLISHLQISKALPPPPPPPSLQEQHMSDISSPASTSFSPSPLSPQIRMPATPSAPSTPTSSAPTPHSARLLSASPEPFTPTPGNSPGSPMATSSPGKIRSRFGSLFFNKSRQHSFDERVLSEQEEIDAREKENADLVAVLKKKRMSTGSLQIPIGAFLSNTFRTKQQQQQQLQQVQDQDQSQQQQQPKKRRGLLPKLPKLDTRPRIVISKSAAKKQKEAKRSATGNGDETHVPPGNSTATAGHEHAPSPGLDVVPGSLTKSGGGGSKSSSSLLGSPALLSPFYLPPQIRTGERNDDPMATTATAKGSQAGQQLLDVSFNPTFDWHQDTQVFYDDRWDRASVRTVDTEIIRLSDDPNFPGYPERNDYWQQHCRIRERRWKHQIQKHQQQQLTESRSPRWMSGGGKADPVTGLLDEDSGSLLEEEDEYDEDGEPLSARLRGVTDLLHSLPERRTRQSTAPQSSEQNRFRQRRVRYTTYSAYIAAMQVKSKNRTDHKRSLDVAAIAAPHDGSDSDKLMTDVRTLRERSMVQPASVKDTADMFEEAFMGDSSVTDHSLDPAQRRHVQRRNGTNLGSSDDESEGQLETRNRVRPMLMPKTLQRQSQPDSGILFVTAAATTAEVYPTLVHDPRDQLMTKSAKSSAYKNNNHTSTTATSPFWIEDGCDEGMIGSLVASYFDKRVLEALDNGKCSENGCDGNGGCGDGCCVGYGGGGLGGVGNGFMMMQSSFGDQGSAYPDQQPPPSPQQPQKQSSGYMLLVLDRVRCQYYENGTRKRGPQWDPHVEEVCSHGPGGEDNSNQVGHDMMTTTATTATTTTRTDVIEEGEEELDEEELAWMEQQRQRHSFSPDLKRPERGKSKIDGDSSRVHSVDGESAPAAPAPEGAAVGAVQEQGQVQVQEVDPLGSLAVIDSPLSPRFTAAFSESPTINPSSSQVFPLPSRGASTSSTSTALAPARPHYMVVSSSSTSSYTNPPSRLASANGLSNLSRIRGAKSRPSLSYSVLPTLSTSSYASSTLLTTPPSASISTSTSATTLISSTPSNLLNNPPTLRHQTSGSITPTSTLYSGGGTPPAAPSSPQAATAQSSSSSSSTLLPSRKLSWSDLPSQPTSATALLRDALSKPAPAPILSDGASTTSTTTSTMTDPAQRLKDQWAQKLRSQSVIFKSSSSLSSPASMMAARSRSMLLSPPLLPALASKRWMRNSSAHLLSPPQPHPGALDPKSRQPPPLQPVVQAQKQQSRQDTLSEGDLETEADQEMEEELRHLVDDDSTVTTFKAEQQQQQSKKSPLTARRTKRAMSMVELSASTSASQFKAAVSATRQRYKAEPSISTSTMAILQSEGMYHWNEFFD
ncbi:hypothetical protein BGX29_003029, partial [Mortierella sp. GBA35]